MFRENISAPKNPCRIESSLQRRHLAQVLVTIKLAQIFAFQLSNSMLGGDCSAHLNRASDELTINGPGFFGFIIVARQDVHVHVIVADVSENGVTKISATQSVLIKAQHSSE